MKQIDTNYFQYDILFQKYPGMKQAYQWYQNNSHKYQFLNKIKLFKKYFYTNKVKGDCDIYFIGALPDDLDDNFINLYALETHYDQLKPIMFQLIVQDFTIKDTELKYFLYDSYKNPEEYLQVTDI